MVAEDGATSGAKTLARGIAALQAVVEAEDGLSAQEVADQLGIHRTIAHRMLVTLAAAGLIAKGGDARYRGAVGLVKLQSARYTALQHQAEPLLHELAERLGATVTLLVAENGQAVALLASSPANAKFQLGFSQGDTHPLHLAAGGHALRSLMDQYSSDSSLQQVRDRGYAMTQGEVEPGAWGLAVPIRGVGVPACINVISHREDVVCASIGPVIEAARDLEQLLMAQI